MKFKSTLVALIIFGFSLASASCNNEEKKSDDLTAADVPTTVQSAFTAKYPTATDAKWEKAKEDDKPTFKVKFMNNDKEVKAEFGEDGTFIKDKAEE